MYFDTASLISRMIGKMFGGSGGSKFSVMDTYSWLWSDKERKEMAEQQFMTTFLNNLQGKGVDGNG